MNMYTCESACIQSRKIAALIGISNPLQGVENMYRVRFWIIFKTKQI